MTSLRLLTEAKALISAPRLASALLHMFRDWKRENGAKWEATVEHSVRLLEEHLANSHFRTHLEVGHTIYTLST